LLPVLLLISQSAVPAQTPSNGSRVRGNLSFGYYASSDVYRYAADVNAWLNYGWYNDARFYFRGGILTQIKGGDGESFQPDRFRGTLETGAALSRGRSNYTFFIRHRSYHDIDRYDGLDESYEIYGVQYCRKDLCNLTFSAGAYQNTRDVDYDWDFLISFSEPVVGHIKGRPVYISGDIHRITEDGSLPDRDGFWNYSAEVGLESPVGVKYFVSYRKVNDVDRFDGVTDRQILTGIRYQW
jgi:hypothetical protein